MSHVAYGWVISHMDESCHVWMNHVTYEWVMSRMNESCHVWMSRVTYEWVTSRIKESSRPCHMWSRNVWISYVTYQRVMSHMDESCRIWMSHVTYEWNRVTYEWVMSHMDKSCHVWMSRVTYQRVMSRIRGCVAWLFHMWHDSFTCWLRPVSTVHTSQTHVMPRTEEIRLSIITTAKISNKVSRESPYISNTLSRESPKFPTNLHVSKRSPWYSKDLTRFL